MDIVFQIIISSLVAFVAVGIILTLCILFVKAKLVSTAPVEINVNDSQDLSFQAEGGSTLLNVLLSNSFAISSPCGGKATCQQCRVQVTDGGGDPLETELGAFTPREIDEGWRLSCQCKVKGDIKIHLEESQCSANEVTATVVSNKNVATFIKEVVVVLDEGSEVNYIPGDYMQVFVPRFQTNTDDWKETIDEVYWEDWKNYEMFGQKIDFQSIEEPTIRAYSMASYPGENYLKFNVRIATPPPKGKCIDHSKPWGICSSYLFSLKEGDKVTLSGPFGESHMIDDDRPVYFLIGGAGSSFGRSHILDLFFNQNTKRKIELWYGARSLRENIYEDDFKKLAEERENFSYHLVLSEPLAEDFEGGWPKDDPVKTNFLFKAFELGALKEIEMPEDCLYYVCGPPMHNKSVINLLDAYGVEEDSIVLDDFGS